MKVDFFHKRVGPKLGGLNKLIDEKPVIIFFLAKKNAGKGTYAKLLNDITDNRFVHLSVGDLVRAAQKQLSAPEGKKAFIDNLSKFYLGKEPLEEMIENFLASVGETSNLLPTPAIIALIEFEISKHQGKSIIIDGFPRSHEQVELAFQMQDDFQKSDYSSAFVELNCTDEVLLVRQLYRKVCPRCQTPKNTKVLLTEKIDYDKATDEFHLVCDRPECGGVRMIAKQGDAEGPEKIRARQQEMAKLFEIIQSKRPHAYFGVNNHVLVSEAHKHEQEDFTKIAGLQWDPVTKQVKKEFRVWVTKDEQGKDVYSRWPEPVVAELVSELHNWLERVRK